MLYCSFSVAFWIPLWAVEWIQWKKGKNMLVSILVGAISGWLAGLIMDSKGGIIRNIILGLVGGAVGNWIFRALDIMPYSFLGHIVVGVVGAVVVIWVGRLIFGHRDR